MKVLVTAFFLFFIAHTLYGQSHYRRGNPTSRYARDEYYVIDSDDDSTTLRPTYLFVDTSYARTNYPWHEITWSSNPDNAADSMLLSYDSLALPFFQAANVWALPPARIDTLTDLQGNRHAVFVPGTSLSTNGTISLLGKDSSPVNYPMDDFNDLGSRRVVAALWADWELLPGSGSNPSKIYVRPAPDTYLVSYYNLGLKGTNGAVRATFQIAFNHNDS